MKRKGLLLHKLRLLQHHLEESTGRRGRGKSNTPIIERSFGTAQWDFIVVSSANISETLAGLQPGEGERKKALIGKMACCDAVRAMDAGGGKPGRPGTPAPLGGGRLVQTCARNSFLSLSLSLS